MKIKLPNGIVLEGRGKELAGVLKRLNISLPAKVTSWIITEPPTGSLDPVDQQPSALIRAEVRGKILPRLRDEGQYPGDPKAYVPILKDLAQRYGVTYNTVMASWRKCWRVLPA